MVLSLPVGSLWRQHLIFIVYVVPPQHPAQHPAHAQRGKRQRASLMYSMTKVQVREKAGLSADCRDGSFILNGMGDLSCLLKRMGLIKYRI